MVTIWNVCIRTAVWWPISSFCKWGNWVLASSHVWKVPEQRSTLHVCQTGFWLLALLFPLFEFSPLPASQDTVYVPGIYTVNDVKCLHGTTPTAAVTGVLPGLPQWWSSWQITFSVLFDYPPVSLHLRPFQQENCLGLQTPADRWCALAPGCPLSFRDPCSALSPLQSWVNSCIQMQAVSGENSRCFLMASHPALPTFSSVQSLSRVWLFATSWIAACQASLSITNSWSSLRLTSIESVMPSSHLILCHPLLLLPPIPPSIRVFSNKSTLRIRWPKYWSFSFSIIPSKEIPGLISFTMDWLDLLAVQGTFKSLLQHHSSKASILRHSAFFTVQLSHPYMTTKKP